VDGTGTGSFIVVSGVELPGSVATVSVTSLLARG